MQAPNRAWTESLGGGVRKAGWLPEDGLCAVLLERGGGDKRLVGCRRTAVLRAAFVDQNQFWREGGQLQP